MIDQSTIAEQAKKLVDGEPVELHARVLIPAVLDEGVTEKGLLKDIEGAVRDLHVLGKQIILAARELKAGKK